MQPNLDVRRHADGSIDFDFYRRRAIRERRETRVRILARLPARLWETLRGGLSAMTRVGQTHGSRPG